MSSTEIARSEQTRVEREPDRVEDVRHWVVPPVEVLEKEGDLRLCLDVPGATRDGLEVKVDQGVLAVTARRADQPDRGYRRRFRLPDHADVSRVAATLRHGILTIEVPRSEASRPRRIDVRID